MQLDEVPDHREADADAALGPIERARILNEQVEGALEQVGGHADTLVAHAHDRVLVLHRQRDVDGGAWFRVLRGVVQEVAEDLDQTRRIGVDEDRVARPTPG